MYCDGRGVDADYAQALPWIKKAAAQDHSGAVGQLGVMYMDGDGDGVTSSWRRAREYYERAIGLGNTKAVKNMQLVTESIRAVTSQRSNHSALLPIMRGLTLTPPPHLPLGEGTATGRVTPCALLDAPWIWENGPIVGQIRGLWVFWRYKKVF